MTSSIDQTQPPAGAATTLAVRQNFAAAKSEIEALQDAVAAIPIHLGASGLARISTEEVFASSDDRLITFDDPTVPASPFFNPSTDPTQFVIPSGYDGEYLLSAGICFTPSGVGPVSIYMVAPNSQGVTSQVEIVTGESAHLQMIYVQEVMHLSETDAVNLYLGNWTTDDLTLSNTAGWFSIAKIG